MSKLSRTPWYCRDKFSLKGRSLGENIFTTSANAVGNKNTFAEINWRVWRSAQNAMNYTNELVICWGPELCLSFFICQFCVNCFFFEMFHKSTLNHTVKKNKCFVKTMVEPGHFISSNNVFCVLLMAIKKLSNFCLATVSNTCLLASRSPNLSYQNQLNDGFKPFFLHI